MEKNNLFFFFISIFLSSNFHTSHSTPTKTSIIFATLGRSNYNFDIYTQPIITSLSPSSNSNHINELRLTDGISVNYNGHFPNTTSSQTLHLIYVSERNGISNIYLDSVYLPDDSVSQPGSRSALEVPTLAQFPLLKMDDDDDEAVSMNDRPSLVGDQLVYVSTRENSGVPRTSWAAVYSTHIRTGSTRRLTPKGVTDFSPSISPSGVWTAVASYGERGSWGGEVDELGTDIYVFLTRTGLNRVKIVDHGGWPCWADDHTIYFHRRDKDDGWWSVYRAILPRVINERVGTESVRVERVTPPGLHGFTPATSPGNNEFIALATRRPGSNYRHIELFDLVNKKFHEVTRPSSPAVHHYNPFISPDSTRVGYHKCRGENNEEGVIDHTLFENTRNPEPRISTFRVDGSYPSFSPRGDRIAYVKSPGLYIVDYNGLNRRKVYEGTAFSTAWDPVREGVVYTSGGPTFASERTQVDVLSINVDDDDEPSIKKLTHGYGNNAFPSPSPDGKWVVFRSGRSGHKNLYIMDAVEGETGGLKRLTDGPWTDTMANWSHDGEWIAFSSDRENPGEGSFELFMIHPNGSGLHKVLQSGSGGRVNHPWFSPDGKSIAFTSDYVGVSAEPISNPHHYQPYGDIFIAKVDGSEVRRMTHNSYEDGTPTWGPTYLNPMDVDQPLDGPRCVFDDCHWLNIEAKLDIEVASPNTHDLTSRVQC